MNKPDCCNQECSQGRNCPYQQKPVSLVFIIVLVAGLAALALLGIGALISSFQ